MGHSFLVLAREIRFGLEVSERYANNSDCTVGEDHGCIGTFY